MKATKSKMAIGINCAVTVVLLRETIGNAEEKQGFSGLPLFHTARRTSSSRAHCHLSPIRDRAWIQEPQRSVASRIRKFP
jgi:hypothetical protein